MKLFDEQCKRFITMKKCMDPGASDGDSRIYCVA